MYDTTPVRPAEEQPPVLTLERADFADARYLRNVGLILGRRISGERADLATVFEARLDHPEADDFPEIVCKRIPRKSGVEGLGFREKRVYEVIRNRRDKESCLHLAHLVADDTTDDYYYFVLERYGDTAYEITQRASGSEERARRVERFFVSGYLALSELAGFGLAMRDVHPLNFLCRSLPKAASNPYGLEYEVDYDFVAVDFGHAHLGPPISEGTLSGLPHVQHPDLLGQKDLAHRGFIDDLFSLAVVAHILLTKNASTPWVVKGGTSSRIRYEDHDARTFLGLVRKNALEFSPALPVEGASHTLLNILEKLLTIGLSERERWDYADNELLPLMVQLAPWAEDSLERAEARRTGVHSDGRQSPVAFAEPELPTPAHTEPHSVTYLAELSDFRPQPKLRPEREQALTQRDVRRGAAAWLREGVPFLVAASSVPLVSLAASHMASLLPAKWLSVCLVMAWISAVIDIGIIGVSRNWYGATKSFWAALARGIIPVILVFIALIAVPTALVAGAQALLIYVPAVSWRFEDWSWPQWALLIATLAALTLFALAWTWASRKKLLRWTAGILIAAAVTPTLVAAAPPLGPQPEITPTCGQPTVPLSTATANICIPVPKNDWTTLSKEEYAKDPFVASMKFPQYASAGTGWGSAGVVLASDPFPCLRVYIVSEKGLGSFNGKLYISSDVTDPQSKITPVKDSGPDGRSTRVRLGSQSYIVYPNTQELPESGTVTGTTTYAALAGGQLLESPDSYASGTYSTFAIAVQRGCSTIDQERIQDSVRSLVASIKVNERSRLDLMDMQYNDRALLEHGLSPENIDIPLIDGVSSTSWSSPLPGILDKSTLASGAVNITRADSGPWVQVDFMDHKPDDFDNATAASPIDGWTATENHSATDSKSNVTTTARSFFQKQTVDGRDYYVRATLSIQDTNAYDKAAADRVHALVAGIHLSNPQITYVVGTPS